MPPSCSKKCTCRPDNTITGNTMSKKVEINLKKNIDNLDNLSLLINYYKESPRAYLSVIFFATIASLLELIGITSILPAISFYLGESNINMPTFMSCHGMTTKMHANGDFTIY